MVGLDVVGHGLNLHVHVLSFVSWRNMELDVVSDFVYVAWLYELSWHVMRTCEETHKASEYPRTSRKADAIDIVICCFHDIIGNLHMKFCVFETIRMDQTLKGG